MIKRAMHEIESILLSDGIVLNYPELRIRENRVNLHYYHAEQVDKTKPDLVNLGDYLSHIVVTNLLCTRGLSLDSETRTAHLYAIGSILLMGYQNATVWGSGLPYEPGRIRAFPHRFRRLDIRAVRGPLTRNTLMQMGFKCPEIYGDPAVLMPLIYQPLSIEKTKEYVYIPHYQREDAIPNIIDHDCIVSMATENYETVINQICSAKKVISSSLHGIILAEAYGVPAVFYQDRPVRFSYKYDDWYSSTGRNLIAFENIDDALKASVELPELSQMQRDLINAFPYDLWV